MERLPVADIHAHKETGKLFLEFSYMGVRCHEQTALSDTPANRQLVQRLANRVEQEIRTGAFDYAKTFPGSKAARMLSNFAAAQGIQPHLTNPQPGIQSSLINTPRFGEFAKTWLYEKTPEWRPSYFQTVSTVLERYLFPAFGHEQVGLITKADLLSFRSELVSTRLTNGKQLSNCRINKIMGFARQIMNEAADRYDFRSPYRNIKSLRSSAPDVHPFSLQEVNQIIERIRPDYRYYMIVRFYTGMRTGELHGLRWENVDFDNQLILVRETLVRNKLMEGAKTLGSIRDVPMLPHVFRALKAQRKTTQKNTQWVFCSPNGSYINNDNFTDRVWKPLLANLGFKYRRLYQTRHTAATLMLAAGESPEWVARVLGHSNTQMLFTVYSRYIPNLTRNDGSAIARLLDSKGSFGSKNLNEDRSLQ